MIEQCDIEVLEAWPGGPLREFAQTRPASNWIPYQAHSFTGVEVERRRFSGSYVCSLCRRKVNGIYSPNSVIEAWHCSDCRNNQPGRAQPEHLRMIVHDASSEPRSSPEPAILRKDL